MDQSIVNKIENYLNEQIETLKFFDTDSGFPEVLRDFKRRESVINDGMTQGRTREYMERLTLKYIKWRLSGIGVLNDDQIIKDLDLAINSISDKLKTQ